MHNFTPSSVGAFFLLKMHKMNNFFLFCKTLHVPASIEDPTEMKKEGCKLNKSLSNANDSKFTLIQEIKKDSYFTLVHKALVQKS